MKKCRVSNYNPELHSNLVDLSEIESKDLVSLMSDINFYLTSQPFSTNIDESTDVNNYSESINKLLQKVDEELPNAKIGFELTKVHKKKLFQFLKSIYLPKPKTRAETQISALAQGIDITTYQQLQRKKLNEILSDIYESSIEGLDKWRQQQFDHVLMTKTIIDTSGEGHITDNNKDLCNNIINYQNDQYKLIRAFLTQYYTNDLNTDDFPEELYIAATDNPKIKIKNYSHVNTLTAMYNIIQSLKHSGSFKTDFENGWIDSIDNVQDSKNRQLYDAVNAFINLSYFDELIENSDTKYIKINHDQSIPINVENDLYGTPTYTYKYQILIGNNNMEKSWGGDEFQNSLDHIANFVSFLIEQIPVCNYTNGLHQFGVLTPKDFIGTFVKLKSVGTTVSNPEFKNAIETISNPNIGQIKSLQKIFNMLFEDKRSDILYELNSKGFDINNMNVLYSVYNTVFKTTNKNSEPKSWLQVENKYFKNTGIRSRYNLIDTIFNTICSNTALNYLQSYYDKDSDSVITNIKDKYSISKVKFDIINTINNATSIISNYDIQVDENNKQCSVNISGIDYTLIVNKVGRNLLTNKNTIPSYYEAPLVDTFKSININARDTQNHLLSRLNLSKQEEDFMNFLTFLDSTLNTTFSKDSIGMTELSFAIKQNPDFLKSAFITAVRSLIIKNINNDFKQSILSGESHYAQSGLFDYLATTQYAFLNDETIKKDYFKNGPNGLQLIAANSNEKWIIELAQIKALLSKDTAKVTINDYEQKKIPNYSPSFLSGDINEQMYRSGLEGRATANLLFSNNRDALLDITIDTEVKFIDNTTKKVKDMTEGELLHHALVNKFLIPLSNDKTVYIQSTTQSDKTKFIANHIDLLKIRLGSEPLSELIKSSKLEEAVINGMLSTYGKAYNEVYTQVIDDYKKLFPSIKSVDDIMRMFRGEAITTFDNKEVTITKESELINTVNRYNKLHRDSQINFYLDGHYRVITHKDANGKKKKVLAFNELLEEFATNLYNQNSSARLKRRLEHEKKLFAQSLIDKQVIIPVTDQLRSIMETTFGMNSEEWIYKDPNPESNKQYLIIAKQNGVNKLYQDIDYDQDLTLNPMINAFFYIDNLIGNNLRFGTTGSEINHKIKSLNSLDLKSKIKNADLFHDTFLMLNPDYDNTYLTFHDVKNMINKGKDLLMQGTIVDKAAIKSLIDVYNDQIYLMENLGQNVQFKRNVIMSATMTKFTPSLSGIPTMIKMACIKDISANVFNFTGDTDSIDAHDGSAFVSPFESNLENNSLGPNEVGANKKAIQHYYDNKYMMATLAKYATFSMTNQWMRQSVGNDLNNNNYAINLHNMFKKMHNQRWHVTDNVGRSIEGQWVDGKIDLINGCGFKRDSEISFADDIMEQTNHPENQLYYNDNDTHIKIIDLGMENGVYYTIEQEVDQGNQAIGEQAKVYHYFDNNSKHIKSKELLSNTSFHTIDSIYELHTALGGIWSEQYSDGRFVFSENSNKAVTNYMNNVATLKEGADPNELTINSYDQPLKRAMIHVLANNTAIKNGGGNINDSSSWYDNKELSYINIDTSTYGIQLDPNHEADMSTMTEFSQVISALDVGGNLHDYVSQVYNLLGQTALEMSKIELNAIEEFKKFDNISDLYDVVGRTIMNNIRSNYKSIGLTEAILENIKQKFNINIDHSKDVFKIPFSDPNIYSKILTAFVSNINQKSIKRKYPGSGTVMVPSYNISMIYDIDGNILQFEDVLKLSHENQITSEFSDTTEKNQDIVRKYLKLKQDEMPKYNNAESFIPTDNVLVTFNGTNAYGKTQTFQEHVSLNEIHDYYSFQDNPIEYLQKRGYSNIKDISYQKDITIPRNLAPIRMTWDYTDALGNKHSTNIFNHWRVKGQIQDMAKLKDYIDKNHPDKESIQKYTKTIQKKWDVQKAFEELHSGLYQAAKDTKPIKIENFKSQEAEIIMSNMYKTTFNIKDGDSLADVLKAGKSYFKVPTVTLESDAYDLVYTKINGDHTFITFKPLAKDSENFNSFYREWRYINKAKYVRDTNVTSYSPTVVHNVYNITQDNVRQFEIGREILREDIVWDESQNAFCKNGIPVLNQSNFRNYNGQILEYIEFVTKHKVNEIDAYGNNQTYELYNINKDALRKCFEIKKHNSNDYVQFINGEQVTLSESELIDYEMDQYIGKLLGDIYKSQGYNGIQLNRECSQKSGKILQSSLHKLSKELNYDQNLSDYVNQLSNIINNTDIDSDLGIFQIPGRQLTKALNKYNIKNQDIQYTSFLKSQYFIAARIPSQTLQSFMAMKCVGFTGVSNGQCFVTAWQTWLQGSDYRQNCSL